MLASAVVRELIAAGVTGDALVMALERIEAAGKPGRSKGAERTARWREKKSPSQGVTSVTSDVTSVTPSPLVPPLSPAPLSPPIIPPTQPPARDLFDETDAALRKIEGISEHPVAVDPVIGPIVALLQQGYNLRTEIIPSIKRQIAKRGTRRVSRWSFFVPGVIDDRAATNPSAPSQPLAEWEKRLAWARQHGKWAYTAWGPAPHKPGCRVPEAIIKPDDGRNWIEWKAA